ncbi:Uncharacterised protein [BD1-7 clade bacterium]|uniref:Fatty acid hydroxylase domain-containing protein n=1 Tax=BD1-7 clade bacterium TaxID=2029982 RepID=A0A5S9R166_9GAMM|nr:Uncharacterised protein [BD1-7 clade bacterium]
MDYIHKVLLGQVAGMTLFTYAVAGIFLVLEQCFPSARYPSQLQAPKMRRKRWGKNAGCFLIFIVPFMPLFEAIPTLVFTYLAPFRLSPYADNVFYMVFGVLALDFSVYVSHRLSHQIPVMWSYHRVHHMDEFLDTTSAFRFHVLETAQTILFRVGVIALLGLNTTTVLIYLYLNAVVLIYQHTNIKTPERLEYWIGKVFVTPSIHWVHHNATLPETNTNYCILFSFWDVMLGTRSSTHRNDKTVIGLDVHPDQSLWRLAAFPMILRKKTSTSEQKH